MDFSATSRNASLKDWIDALKSMVDLNGKSFEITESEVEAAYDAGKRVDEFFCDKWEK